MNHLQKTIEEGREKFDEEFENTYYGKDDDGVPNYPPTGFKDDVKSFLISHETALQIAMLKDMIEKWEGMMKTREDTYECPKCEEDLRYMFNSCLSTLITEAREEIIRLKARK
jgi:hypothetical protein